MFNGRKISILLAVLILVGIAGCGGGSQTTITSGSGGPTGGTGGSGIIALAWDAPTTNVDGSPITALAGFKIYYGRVPGAYTTVVDVGNATNYSINNLTVGTYYISVTAYDAVGSESGFSNEVSKTVT